MYVLQILDGQLVSFHYFIAFLNQEKISVELRVESVPEFLCRTENLIIQWALENELIETCHVFNIYYSGIGASSVVQIQKLVLPF